MSRRRALALLGGAGLMAVAACEPTIPFVPDPADPPLYARAQFGLASAVSPAPGVVNGGLHAAENRFGTSFTLACTFISFDTTWSDKLDMWRDLGARGKTLALSWGPSKYENTVLLTDVAEGRYQEHVDEVLTGIAAYQLPVVCRWGWEMNGDWSEYSAAYDGEWKGCNDPSEYVAAWRYVVGRARSLGVQNLRWLFCPNGNDVGDYPMEEYWPGADVVDLIGADAYNGFAEWTSFHDLFVGPYKRLALLRPDSEFWVGETGCVESTEPGVSKAGWAHEMFYETRLPLLKAVNYFDEFGSRDWRIQTSSASEEAFATGFRLAAEAAG